MTNVILFVIPDFMRRFCLKNYRIKSHYSVKKNQKSDIQDDSWDD